MQKVLRETGQNARYWLHSINKNDEVGVLKAELNEVNQKLDDVTRAINLLMEKVEPQTKDEILGLLKNKQ